MEMVTHTCFASCSILTSCVAMGPLPTPFAHPGTKKEVAVPE